MLKINAHGFERAPRRRLKGATLLEALITVVVIGFGLLGVAGLLVKGMTANTFSNYRSIAIAKAYEIADRIRANGAAWAALNAKSIGVPESEPPTSCETTTSGSTNSSAPTPCTGAQQAAWDLWVWNQSVQAALPSGSVSFSPDPVAAWSAATANSVAFQITVSWMEKATATGLTNPDIKSFVLRFEP